MTINVETILAGLRLLNTDLYGDHKIPEQVLRERANNIATALMSELDETMSKTVIRVMNERERLIYWLVQTTSALGKYDEITSGAEQCLADLGYELRGERAARMVELGEPRAGK